MSDPKFDFAVLGSSPFAALLAIALVVNHKKNVCLVQKLPAPLQLVRDVGLSVAPVTRPETWSLLTHSNGNLNTLLGGRAPSILTRIDAIFAAYSHAGVDALGHIRHMAAAFGHITTPFSKKKLGAYSSGFAFEGVKRFRHRPFYETLPDWLTEIGVTVLEPARTEISVGRKYAVLDSGEGARRADAVIVTDADVGSKLLALPKLKQLCAISTSTALLSEPGGKSIFPVICDIDANAQYCAHPDGRLECVVHGNSKSAQQWLSRNLPTNTETRLAGMVEFPVLRSTDGAPIIGQVSASRLYLALALGQSAPFMAPAVARHFAGNGTPSEDIFFQKHNLRADRKKVQEFRRGSQDENP